MQITQTPIDKLIPYINNARTHSDEQVAQIAASIKEFGFNNPVLVDKHKGIIAGHGRLLAAKKLGLNTVPTIELSHLSDAQRKAYILADNRLALNAGWDVGLLKIELDDLLANNINLQLLGFDDNELAAILNPAVENEGLCDPDDVPALAAEAISKPGDLWLLGEHRLLCGDSTDPTAVARLLGENKADLVFTDPPYNANYSSRVDKDRPKPWGGIINDNMSDEEFDVFLSEAMNTIVCQVKDGASVYCCIDWKHISQVEKTFRKNFNHKASIIWDKKHFGLGTYYRTQYEIILFGVYGEKLTHWNAGSNERDVWSLSRDPVSDYVHPTQKPVELIERAINNSSQPDNIVLDIFSGSGTTIIACEKTRRKACVCELSPNYCDIQIKRWQKFTGKDAKLESTNKTFNEMNNGEEETSRGKTKMDAA